MPILSLSQASFSLIHPELLTVSSLWFQVFQIVTFSRSRKCLLKCQIHSFSCPIHHWFYPIYFGSKISSCLSHCIRIEVYLFSYCILVFTVRNVQFTFRKHCSCHDQALQFVLCILRLVFPNWVSFTLWVWVHAPFKWRTSNVKLHFLLISSTGNQSPHLSHLSHLSFSFHTLLNNSIVSFDSYLFPPLISTPVSPSPFHKNFSVMLMILQTSTTLLWFLIMRRRTWSQILLQLVWLIHCTSFQLLP